ncbi:MAG: ATP-binding cassette domain-containing protein [Gemmatimonadota bacterium]|nr:ATP-binding cassette domain-containing protein [Gemmatimonadota bacterium]
MIYFKQVSAGYPRHGLVLEEVDFHIGKGEFVFLTGPSASGKSTLLKLLYHDLRPSAGEVIVAEFSSRRIRKSRVPLLRRKLGIVFQDFGLLENRTAGENVAYALEVTGTPRSEIRTRVPKLLNGLGLSGKVRSYPHELSGGEQQRVAIARALVSEPFVLIGDEPTGNLDPEISQEIMRILVEINTLGTAVLVATHDYSLLEGREKFRRLHLAGGRLVYDGPVGDFKLPGTNSAEETPGDSIEL